ncbi:MAG TPA: integration host factor, actinobacterial type [Actinomycetota bacterium]|nr:integration host factor, actinobacterial type [Actinomycetota bacterium]
MPLPPLSEEQRKAALEKAAEARRRRAEIKAKLKNGSMGLTEVLRDSDNDEIVGKMKVSAMLEALPGVGKVRAQKVMEELGISTTRRLRGLGEKQRTALRERFGK